jgi:hypothetical protein
MFVGAQTNLLIFLMVNNGNHETGICHGGSCVGYFAVINAIPRA